MGKLQAAIALLPDAELSNRLGAAAMEAHAASRGRLRWPRLPAHLSLKQPFAVESVAAVERVVAGLAGELAPVHVRLGALEVQPPSPGSPEAVLWVGVDDPATLLAVDQRLDAALLLPAAGVAAPPATDVAVSLTAGSFPGGDIASPFVSEAYRFHVTLGFLPAASLVRDEAGEVPELPSLAGTTATFAELGLFVYEGLPRAGWQCMLLARCPLSGALESA